MRDANKQNTLQTQTIHEVRAIKKIGTCNSNKLQNQQQQQQNNAKSHMRLLDDYHIT